MHGEQEERGGWKFGATGFGEPRAKEEAQAPEGRGVGQGWAAQEAGGRRLGPGWGVLFSDLCLPTHPSLGWALLETLQGKDEMGRGTRGGGCLTGMAGLAGPRVWQKSAPGRNENGAQPRSEGLACPACKLQTPPPRECHTHI